MLTNELPVEWPAVASEDEVREQVRSRARSIKLHRRVPLGMAAASIVTAVAVLATSGGGDPSSLRTAGESDGSLVDKSVEVDAFGNKVEARAELWTGPAGGRFQVNADTGSKQTSGAAGVAINPNTAWTRLTTHPLFSDPAGDADGREGSSTYGPLTQTPEYFPFVDIRRVDMALLGAQDLRVTIDVESFDRFDELAADDTVFLSARGTIFDDVEIDFQIDLDRYFNPTTHIWMKTTTGGVLMSVYGTATIDHANSLVTIDTTLDHINERLDSTNWTARRAQGELVVKQGTKVANLSADSLVSRRSAAIRFVRSFDKAHAPAGSYWAIGD